MLLGLTPALRSDIITKLVRESSNTSGNIHKATSYEFPTTYGRMVKRISHGSSKPLFLVRVQVRLLGVLSNIRVSSYSYSAWYAEGTLGVLPIYCAGVV